MIFARRAHQRRLHLLRGVLDDPDVDKLVARLNRPGADRLAAMWETAILSSLLGLGNLSVEQPLPSGRRPDVGFNDGTLAFTADITTVSDEGLDQQNPYSELSELIEAAKTKLGMKIGGMDIRVAAHTERTSRGTRTTLRLPPRSRIGAFVRSEIVPRIRQQLDEGKEVIDLVIQDETADIAIRIDPKRSPYNSGGYASYDAPTIKDRNPLYNALKAKATQLKGARGFVGVIVGDGDARALADRGGSWNEITARQIADEFLRQHSSIHFVLILSVREEPAYWPRIERPVRRLHALFAVSKTNGSASALEPKFIKMMEAMPLPVAMPVNAAVRAREARYDWGYHGGGQVSSKHIKISSREIIEVLAGVRRVEDFHHAHGWASAQANDPKKRANPFARMLLEGRLPATITVEKTGENENDDWLDIEFGDIDPAISPFR